MPLYVEATRCVIFVKAVFCAVAVAVENTEATPEYVADFDEIIDVFSLLLRVAYKKHRSLPSAVVTSDASFIVSKNSTVQPSVGDGLLLESKSF